jgi:hypothetical protein
MERRTEHRYEVWLPVKVDSLKEGIAVTHNASQGGMLMVTASKLDPHGLWPHRMAVEFDEPVPDLEWVLAGLKSPAG